MESLENKEPDVVKAVISVQDLIAERMTLMNHAYMQLMNVTTAKEGLECLGQMTLVGRDLEQHLRQILAQYGCPPQFIRRVTPEQIKQVNRNASHELSEDHNLDTIWNHAMYFFQNFLHAQTPERKLKEITSLYYTIKDVSEIAVETKVDRYTNKVRQVKEVIQGGW